MARSDARTRENAIIAAYRAGDLVEKIEEQFGVGRSTIYHILRRTGNLPNRTRRVVSAQSTDATLAGLYELIKFQDRRLEELEETVTKLEAENARLRRSTSTNGAEHKPSTRRKAQ